MPTEGKLLFVHQNDDQKRLLNLYGNHICQLDATYKTTRYSIPLFFIVVKTNVDHQVVGSFAIQDETTAAIREAISVFKSWNPDWQPKSFMVDNCEEEINAIGHHFPDCKVLLCDFHREQAWIRWLSKNSNGMSPFKDTVLGYLRAIADAESETIYQNSVEILKTSQIWKMSPKNFKDWILFTWIAVHKKMCEVLPVGLNGNNCQYKQWG